MTLYQLNTIDTAKFEKLLNEPSDSQLQAFAAHLGEDSQANDWFTEEPPVWESDPVSWVRQRFADEDWYADLGEAEMLAWDHAMRSTLELPELQSTADFTALPVDGIPTLLFDMVAEATEQAGNDSQFLRMQPFRCHELPSQITELEPYERSYWPEHAVVPPTDAAKMIEVFNQYDDLVNGLVPRDPQLARQLETEGPHAAKDVPHLLTFLRELVEAHATWYAPVDC